jgi:hypothetical protein
MGYTTEFTGFFTFVSPLREAQVEYINAFCNSRRMQRFNSAFETDMSQRLRNHTDVMMPYGDEGEFCVDDENNSFLNFDNLELIGVNYNTPPKGQPGLWCDWMVSQSGTRLFWNNSEKFYNYVDWLEYLIQTFFVPWGKVLNGTVNFYGEDRDDCGSIVISNNVVKLIRDRG